MMRFSLPLLALICSFACSSADKEDASGDRDDAGTDQDADDLDAGSGGTTGDGDGLPGTGGGENPGSGGSENQAPGARVVGYVPTYRSLHPTSYDLSALTHLCIAFATPGAPGEVDYYGNEAQIAPLVSAAHAEGVKVLASIAGAAGGAQVANAIQPGGVDQFVQGLLGLMEKYELDGIDVDIEGEHVNSNYEPFVKKLSAALPAGKLLTAAVATWNGDDFSDGALAEFDFINLMSYDHCGPWTDACEHSTYTESLSELAYWEGERGLAAEKMVLGVPFYGYCWGSACPDSAITYADIYTDYPDGRTNDYLTGTNYTISLNSPVTILQKAELAKSHGGIMIWELGQDASGDASLLKVIKDAK